MDYQHVLVPIDFIRPAMESVQTATHLAKQSGAKVTLLHVIEVIDEPADDDETRDFYQRVENQVREQFAIDTNTLSALDQVHHEVIVGRRAREIVRYSSANGVDLIVMSSDRIEPTEPQAAIRLISHQVSMFAQCPVMLVK